MLTAKISILLVEDHRMFREMCARELSKIDKLFVCGEAKDGVEAIELSRKLRPDIILMDINLKGLNGFEATKEIRKIVPGIKIIALSMFFLPAYVKKMRESGGKGYLTKNSSFEELINAINIVYDGGCYVTKELSESNSLMCGAGYEQQKSDQLTKREIEIIGHIKNGQTSKEIASSLYVSLNTVNIHRYNIFKKIKVANVAALIQFAFENGL